MDAQTVMTWLEICGKNDDCSGCCPYGNDGETFDCKEKLMTDAYELMRATYEDNPVVGVKLNADGNWSAIRANDKQEGR